MRFGVFLTTRHLLAEQPHAAAEAHLAEVRLARELGYDSIFAGQHFLPYPLPMVQLWPLLGRISAEAGDMRVGTGAIILAAVNPVETAEHAATMDALTNGRFTLGVGIGYRDEDIRAFAIPGRRAHVFTQKLDVVRRLLDGERVTASGPGYDLHDDYLTLRCVQQPRCPIWMAATRDWGVRKAAELADTWLVSPLSCIRDLERQVALFLEARGGIRPAELPIVREVCVAPTAAQAQQLARAALERRYHDFVATGQSDALPASDTLDLPWDELWPERFLIGSPDSVVEQIRHYRDRLGATEILFRARWAGLDPRIANQTLELLAREVMPNV